MDAGTEKPRGQPTPERSCISCNNPCELLQMPLCSNCFAQLSCQATPYQVARYAQKTKSLFENRRAIAHLEGLKQQRKVQRTAKRVAKRLARQGVLFTEQVSEAGIHSESNAGAADEPSRFIVRPTVYKDGKEYVSFDSMFETQISAQEKQRLEDEARRSREMVWIIIAITAGPGLLWMIGQCMRAMLR